MQEQTGKVLYGQKGWGWVAICENKKVTLLPERGRIVDGNTRRVPKPGEKRPRPQQNTEVLVFGLEQNKELLLAQEWALPN